MTVYYIRRSDNPITADYKEMIVDGLVAHYDLETYPVQVVIVPERLQAMLGPILDDIAEDVVRPLNVFNPGVDVPGYQVLGSQEVTVRDVDVGTGTQLYPAGVEEEPPTPLPPVKRKRGEVPKGICSECGRLAPMTKKGYCKLCAMRKAREAKSAPVPSVPVSSMLVSGGESRSGSAEVITYDMSPVERRQIERHGAIKGKRLG